MLVGEINVTKIETTLTPCLMAPTDALEARKIMEDLGILINSEKTRARRLASGNASKLGVSPAALL